MYNKVERKFNYSNLTVIFFEVKIDLLDTGLKDDSINLDFVLQVMHADSNIRYRVQCRW